MNKKSFFKIAKYTFASLLCVLAVFMGISAARFYIDPVIKNQAVATEIDKAKDGRVNILLLATDKSGLLTDTIMVASVDSKRGQIRIMSIPRDTYVMVRSPNERITSNNKINSVYSRASENNRVNAILSKVKELTGLPINYYAVVNPKGFSAIIDVLGGVYIDVPQRMKYEDPDQGLYIDLYPGYQLLDGNKAEQFCRFRSYPTGDLGRIEAQHAFLEALFDQKLNPALIAKSSEIFKEIEKNLDTNIALYNLSDFLPLLNALNKDSMKTFEMPNNTRYINGISFVVCDIEETRKLIKTEFLGITDTAVSN